MGFTHLYWIRVYYWWLLAKYTPLAERRKYLSVPLSVAARLTFSFVLGLLLVVDAARLCLRRLL